MRPAQPVPQRPGDLWWLLCHDERGRPQVGRQHFAIGLAACALGEAFTDSSWRLDVDGNVVTDPVVAQVLGEVGAAARERIVKAPRVWVEWLATREYERLVRAVVYRMVTDGWLISDGRHTWPKDPMVACAPVTLLVATAGMGHAATDSVRLLAGVVNGCGLTPLVLSGGQDLVRPLQLLAMQLPKPLHVLVEAVEDAVHATASRRR
jgi:hypothetical protein